jgi:REP element-mobilizing transposase RayT
MSTYTQITYQIVFCTKYRKKVLTSPNRNELFKFIWGVLKNKKCKLYRINGVEDHIHILTHLHPSVSLSDLVKDIKISSSIYIKENYLFPDFKCWQPGYGAFTYGLKDRARLIEYVKNQEEHHRVKTSKDELKQTLLENEVSFEEQYLD